MIKFGYILMKNTKFRRSKVFKHHTVMVLSFSWSVLLLLMCGEDVFGVFGIIYILLEKYTL
jgi:hypothetical protein